MRILVTFAIRSEMRDWRGPSDLHESIRVVMTGIGMRRVQGELREALASGVDICIASGLAGSVKTEHRPGTVTVARGVKAGGGKTIISGDGGLIDAAVRCGARPVDFFYTSEDIANSDAERRQIASTADAVDMESFHVLTEAQRAGVPAVAIRTISDSPEHRLPIDFSQVVTDRGELAWMRMAAELLKHPARLPGFVRFGLDSSTAIRNLTVFLDRYVKFLTSNESSYRIAVEPILR
jgi:adenosylhomocysteine nucleosidase